MKLKDRAVHGTWKLFRKSLLRENPVDDPIPRVREDVSSSLFAVLRDPIDSVDRFMLFHGIAGTDKSPYVSDVREVYQYWCAAEGEVPVSAKKLSQALSTRYGVRSYRGSEGRRYSGLQLV